MTSRGTGSDGTVAVGPWLLQLMTLAGETDLPAVAESDAGSPHHRRPAALLAAAPAHPGPRPSTHPDAPTGAQTVEPTQQTGLAPPTVMRRQIRYERQL